MRKRSSLILLGAMVLCVLSATARAETFYAYLEGRQEVPAVATTGTSYASVLRFPSVSPPGQAPITWYNAGSTVGPQITSTFGDANLDFPTPGDYDGDGKDDLVLYRAGASAGALSNFYILYSSTNTGNSFQ